MIDFKVTHLSVSWYGVEFTEDKLVEPLQFSFGLGVDMCNDSSVILVSSDIGDTILLHIDNLSGGHKYGLLSSKSNNWNLFIVYSFPLNVIIIVRTCRTSQPSALCPQDINTVSIQLGPQYMETPYQFKNIQTLQNSKFHNQNFKRKP